MTVELISTNDCLANNGDEMAVLGIIVAAKICRRLNGFILSSVVRYFAALFQHRKKEKMVSGNQRIELRFNLMFYRQQPVHINLGQKT